jgi:heme/copper-type cytochrome/quinol oxidase subunit 1
VSSIMAIGASIIFWPMHAIGLLGLPRRIADCSDCHAAALSLSTLGSVLSICSVSLLVFSLWD